MLIPHRDAFGVSPPVLGRAALEAQERQEGQALQEFTRNYGWLCKQVCAIHSLTVGAIANIEGSRRRALQLHPTLNVRHHFGTIVHARRTKSYPEQRNPFASRN